MTAIFRIFLNDLKTISRNIIAFIVIIGISILPALYAWFNIAANWDPYSATSGLQFAVCNNDKGWNYKALKITAGDEIIEKLKSNNKMGWVFVDEQQAVDGVEDGTYYAAVIIPEDFSENLCSITTGDFRQAQLEYYVNEKKNAIAPKITNAGVSTIENEVKATYVSTITSVIASALNLTADELSGDKDRIVSTVSSSLKDVIENIDSLSMSVDVFGSTLDTLSNLFKTTGNIMPSITQTLKKSSEITPNLKNSIDSAKLFSKKISDVIADTLVSVDTMQKNISDNVNDALDRLETNTSSAANSLVGAGENYQKIIKVNNTLISILENLQNNLGINTSLTVNRLKNTNQKEQDIIDKIYSAADMIESTGNISVGLQNEIRQLISETSSDISQISTAFAPLKENINKTVDSIYGVIESTSDIIKNITNDIPALSDTLDSTQDTVETLNGTFDNVKKLLANSKTKMETLIKRVDALEGDSEIKNLVMTVIQNPEALGKFVSSPVATNTHNIHHVENYGSGMTPFYTSLSFWVGGTILIAIVRTEPTRKQLKEIKKANPAQQYFGRYLIFFMIGQIQALITSLGDIFLLKVQCNNIFLFIIGSLISSFVYTLFIYSLTISFNVVGKALVIVILVIQIAGSGGTFPVEVLPAPFQTISPYLPFRYSINALREAVAGPDISAFWNYILTLLAFVPLALFIGLVLRKPCMKIIEFLEQRLHQSEIII